MLRNASVLPWGRTNFGEECITGPKSICVGLEPNKFCHPSAYRSFEHWDSTNICPTVESFHLLDTEYSEQPVQLPDNYRHSKYLLAPNLRQPENHFPSNSHQTNQIFPIITLVKFSRVSGKIIFHMKMSV